MCLCVRGCCVCAHDDDVDDDDDDVDDDVTQQIRRFKIVFSIHMLVSVGAWCASKQVQASFSCPYLPRHCLDTGFHAGPGSSGPSKLFTTSNRPLSPARQALFASHKASCTYTKHTPSNLSRMGPTRCKACTHNPQTTIPAALPPPLTRVSRPSSLVQLHRAPQQHARGARVLSVHRVRHALALCGG